MSKMSKLILVVMLMVWLGAIIPTQAQSTCGDLSASDCELLQTAQQSTSNLSSATFHAVADLSLSIEFFPDLLQIRLTTDGAYQRQSYDNIDVPSEYRPLFGLNANMSAVLEATVSEFIAPTDNTFISSFDLRYVDGMGYAELTKLLPAIDPFTQRGGWYSADITEYIRGLAEDAILSTDFEYISTLLSSDYWGALTRSGANITRLDDIQADNQSFAVFELVLSVDEYLNENPNIEDPMLDALEVLLYDLSFGAMPDDVLRTNAVFYLDLLRASEFRLLQTVGLTDGYVHQTQFDFNLAPNSDTILEDDPLGLNALGEVELRFSIDFRYTQFNVVIPEITAPEDSHPVRYNDLFGTGDSSPF